MASLLKPLGEKIMNNKKQTGKISKLMLIILIGGISTGTYFANKKGLVSVDKITTMASDVGNRFASFTSESEYTGYGVQLMATKQLDQAKSLMNDFAQDGYSAFVLASQAKGRTLYKVRLGPYDHKPEALAIKDKVIRRYPNNPYVKTSLVIYKPN